MYHVSLVIQCIYECSDVVMKEGNMGIGWRIVRFLEDGREWRLPSVLYANGLVLWGESEKELS